MTRAKSTTDQQPASDDHLTDRRTRISRRTVGLTAEEWSGVDTAIPDIIELLHDVRNVLLDLSYMANLDKPGINSIMRLAGRAVQSMENKEIQVLERLEMAVRSSREGV